MFKSLWPSYKRNAERRHIDIQMNSSSSYLPQTLKVLNSMWEIFHLCFFLVQVQIF
jgi:hypothetical protein